MSSAREMESSKDDSGSALGILVWLAVGLLAACCGIFWLSFRFDVGSEPVRRPILAVLSLFTASFVIYCVAIFFGSRVGSEKPRRRLLWIIFGGAVAFRAVLLVSVPIQEVDIYRYVWDGVVSAEGISPFTYPPAEIKSDIATTDPDLERLRKISNEDAAIMEVLNRVHYSELPTVYPPTSQFVFHLVALTTPKQSPLSVRIFLMKLWLVGFDLAVLWIVIQLLSICRKPIGLSIAYGWCPLVLKEVANSGHLDSIAVFFCALVVYLLARCAMQASQEQKAGYVYACVTSIFFALAVGAKLYPIVLTPLVVFASVKIFGVGRTTVAGIVFLVCTWFIVSPMLPVSKANPENPIRNIVNAEEIDSGKAESLAERDPSVGLATFLKYWEMNDFLFLVVVENLKPDQQFPENKDVWFSIVPDDVRSNLVDVGGKSFGLTTREAPFLITRAFTMLLFVLIAFWLAFKLVRRSEDSRRFATEMVEAAFLTLAWFWLLSPTQNPWYWMWALPFLPFARSKTWYLMSGLLFAYYLRFWFQYHFSETEVMGTGYLGTAFFDFVVPWIEFGPWFLVLAVEGCWRRVKRKLGSTDSR